MENNINSISFGARLITSMQGRNKILPDVAKRFAEKTMGYEGSLKIVRGGSKNPNAIELILNEGKSSYIIKDYGDFTGADFEIKTPEIIDLIADNCSKIYRILRIKQIYNKITDKINRNIERTTLALKANTKTLLEAQKKQSEAVQRMYKAVIDQNSKKIDRLNEQLRNAETRYNGLLESVAYGNFRAQQCVDLIKK